MHLIAFNQRRTAFVTNYSIDLERNRIKKAQYSLAVIAGLLSKYEIEMSS